MEKLNIPVLLLLLALLCPLHAQDYFAGLNIDPTLISQANLAINTLKKSLYLNFNCDPIQFQSFPFGASSPLSFLQSYQNYAFQGLTGFNGGFSGANPRVNCQNSRQRGTVLFTVYQQVVTVTTLLQTIKSYVIEYNNVIIGSNNTVVGDNNFVIGSNNSFTGSNDWVFASDYLSTDPQNGVLII